jgi:predicted transcriptional regulator of viral defense system
MQRKPRLTKKQLRVLNVIKDEPNATIRRIALVVGVSPTRVFKILTELKKHGILDEVKRHRKVVEPKAEVCEENVVPMPTLGMVASRR